MSSTAVVAASSFFNPDAFLRATVSSLGVRAFVMGAVSLGGIALLFWGLQSAARTLHALLGALHFDL